MGLIRARVLCVSTLLLISAVAARSESLHLHIRNFYQVNDHLWRGGQPTEDGIRELAANHVNVVLDLREAGQDTEAEKRLVESLGMKFVNVPLRSTRAPSGDEMRRILSLIVPDAAGRTFVHCLRGKDRTGTVIACYRVQHDGWPPRQALAEAERKGMSSVEFGMHSFILRFSPVDLPAPLATSK
jgi:protein tyrosine/serine phosphatase